MAGGVFNKQDKIRPGVYQNIHSNKMQNTVSEISGIVAIALNLDFGKEKAITRIEKETDIYDKLACTLSNEKVLLLKEILKATNTILVYRLNAGEKAKATVETGIEVIAKCGGTIGNDISVIIANNVEDNKKYDVFTYLDGTVVDEQTITKYEEFKANNYVEIKGTGAITQGATIKLEGGTSTEVTSEEEETEYMNFLKVLETENYNYIAYTGSNDGTKALIVAFIKRMNDEEGIRVKAVMGEYKADYEKIITIKNGVVLEDGRELTKEQCAAYIAAISSCANVNDSNTYAVYQGAIDVSQRLSNADTIKAIKEGNIVFTRRNDESVVVEQDINSLVTFTREKNESFSKNRVVRAIDSVASDIKRIFEENYIGKISNNEDGRSLLRAEIINNIKEKEKIGAFQNFTEEDVVVNAGNNIDSVIVSLYIQPVDSIEKIYMNVEVQ